MMGKQKLYRWSRAIDVHLQHRRRKREAGTADLRIATVTGIGYRLEPVAAAAVGDHG